MTIAAGQFTCLARARGTAKWRVAVANVRPVWRMGPMGPGGIHDDSWDPQVFCQYPTRMVQEFGLTWFGYPKRELLSIT